MSKALLIASYYRSGTSALSGVLNLAGVDMVNSDENNVHNPRGYFENPVLVKRDLGLLRRLGFEWHDVRLMTERWWQRPDVGADTQFIYNELKSHHAESELWAVKHPHLCRLLPIYEEAARRITDQAPGVIHIYRDPWVVAHSQFKKNMLSQSHSLLLWASHVLDAELYSRHLDSVAIDYELLVKDTSAALKRIASTLKIEFPNRSTTDLRNIAQFITPNLRRSVGQERDKTPRVLRVLVEEVWEAALSGAATEKFDRLRSQLAEQCVLLDDLASSRLPVTAKLGVGGQAATTESANESVEPSHAEGSPLRPSERTDVAENRRLRHAFDNAQSAPTVGIVVAVPPGRIEAAFETEASIADLWGVPDEVRYVTTDADAPRRDNYYIVDPSQKSLISAIGAHWLDMSSDYVAVIDAGDRVEPDACLRLSLFAADRGLPAILYTDEISATARDPWIRYKSGFDIERLRGLHYIGGWLWCRRDVLTESGSLDGELSGAEDLDLVLRVYDLDGDIQHLPEALYSRVPGSLRDIVDVDCLRANVRSALDRHLERNGITGRIKWHDGALPGSMVPRYRPGAGQRLSMVLLCDSSEPAHAADLDPQRLASVVEALNIKHLVCAGTRGGMHSEIAAALTRMAEQNTATDTLHLVIEKSEARLLEKIASVVGDETVVFLSLDAHTDDPTWLGHLQGRLSDAAERVGIVGARADYPTPDGTFRFAGPMLLGGDEGVGILGLGHKAGDAGPGGWLLGPQQVDGVAPPCLAVRGYLLRSVEPDHALAGGALWLDLSMQIKALGFAVLWDPSVSVQCPDVPQYAVHRRPDIVAAGARLRSRWGCQSRHHHPMLSLQGDMLSEVTHGLAPAMPRGMPHALLSGAVEGSELAVEWLRAGRMSGLFSASWAPEPIPVTELCRTAPDAWLRVNPVMGIPHDDSPSWRALFSQLPPDNADLKTIGSQAQRTYATSSVLAEALRKRSRNRLHPEPVVPRLPSRLWGEVSKMDRIGGSNLRVLWVDEGDPPDWITSLLGEGSIDWFIVQGTKITYDGQVAIFDRPNDEVSWRDLFLEVRPDVLIRPTRDAAWMDSQLLLRAAAVGAALVADSRFDWPEELPVQTVAPRFAEWRKTLTRMKLDVESVMTAGNKARAAIEKIGWLENAHPESLLLDTLSPSSHVSRVG